MKNITHIISLPRCRTAWLSQAFTQGPDCYGFHDGIGNHLDDSILSPEEYILKLNARKEENIIDCSSGIPSSPKHLEAVQSKIIVIIPDDKERCRDSWITHLQNNSLLKYWENVVDNFEICCNVFSERIVMSVPFKDITKEFKNIWNACCPLVEYDEQRIADLARLNINEIN